jgi:hypothetical protein
MQATSRSYDLSGAIFSVTVNLIYDVSYVAYVALCFNYYNDFERFKDE